MRQIKMFGDMDAQISNCYCTYICHVKLVWKLIEDGAVAVLVLFNDWRDQSNQLVPEFEVVQPRLCVLTITFGLIGINLEWTKKWIVNLSPCERSE